MAILYNLKIDIGGSLLGRQTFLFDLDECPLDYIQQAGGKHITYYSLLRLYNSLKVQLINLGTYVNGGNGVVRIFVELKYLYYVPTKLKKI